MFGRLRWHAAALGNYDHCRGAYRSRARQAKISFNIRGSTLGSRSLTADRTSSWRQSAPAGTRNDRLVHRAAWRGRWPYRMMLARAHRLAPPNPGSVAEIAARQPIDAPLGLRPACLQIGARPVRI